MRFLNEHPGGSVTDPDVNCQLCERLGNASGVKPDCENCHNPILLAENKDAWDLYQVINTRFVYDFHALPLVFEVHNIKCTRAKAKTMLQKLIMIHQIKSEKKKT